MRIKYHPRVIKFLDNLETNTRTRIIDKIKLLQNNPFRYLKALQGTNALKLRIGDYRAFVDVDSKKEIVFVREIRHRRNAYKN